MDDVIVPELATMVKEEKVAVFPGLDEPGEGVRLKHQTSGHVCGGYADSTTLRDLTKITAQVDFGETRGDESELLSYMRHEAEFLTCIESVASETLTIYDIVACFRHKMMRFRHTIKPLVEKVEYYTSFRHFLEEFREKQWPTLHQLAMVEYENCSQTDGESIRAYYERFSELVQCMGGNADDCVPFFVSGLRNEEIRNAVNIQVDRRTMESVVDYADRVQSTLKVEQMNKRRRSMGQSTQAGQSRGRERW